MLGSVAMLWFLLPPPLFTDSIHVFRAAARWPDIPPDAGPAHQITRIGLLLPAWAAQEIAGSGQLTYYAISAVLTGLCPVGCYLAGRALFGDRIGIAAAVVLLVHPFFTVVDPYVRSVNASTGGIMPDAPAAGLFAGGTAAIVAAARRHGRARTALLVTAGLLLGAAALCREFVVLMYPAIPCFLWLLGVPLRRVVTVAVPVAGVAAAAMVHNARVFGDALAPLRASQAVADGGPGTSRSAALARFAEAMVAEHRLGVLFPVALLVAVVGWAVTRDRRLALTLVWFLALWVPLTLLSGVLDPSDPAFDWGHLPRYWTPVFPPLLIGALGAGTLLLRGVRPDAGGGPGLAPRRGARTTGRADMPVSAGAATGTAVLVAVLAAAYLVPAVGAIGTVRRDRAWNELRTWLASRPDLPLLWTDSYTAQTLRFYTRSPLGRPLWRGRVKTFRARRHRLPSAVRGGPLLHSRQGARVPPSRAAGWRPLWRSSDGTTLSIWIRPAAPAPQAAARAAVSPATGPPPTGPADAAPRRDDDAPGRGGAPGRGAGPLRGGPPGGGAPAPGPRQAPTAPR